MIIDSSRIRELLKMCEQIFQRMEEMENRFSRSLEAIHPEYFDSARNLLHYLALRNFDLVEMQEDLAEIGLSSLGSAESHVQSNLSAVHAHLQRLLNREEPFQVQGMTRRASIDRHEENITSLLGSKKGGRNVRIMVTLPTDAAGNIEIVKNMIKAGMSCARINCAKDDKQVWEQMIRNVRKSSQEAGSSCKVLMDLAGPKIRTGTLKKSIHLKVNDELQLFRKSVIGKPASTKGLPHPAFLSISLPAILDDLSTGDAVLFDDGMIGGKVEQIHPEYVSVRITFVEGKGKLKANKGINFPESNLSISGLTEKDVNDLQFIVEHADIVNMSFIHSIHDVAKLRSCLEELGASEIGVMVKIETTQAFRNLPLIMLELMKSYPAGLMIARGDLAVETSWERMAEIQEEMMWLAEAAHMPIVWATQVLERLAKSGLPSRPEITDAAMSQRADCVMLNKGPYILDTIKMLSDILLRMQEHQYKKYPRLRSLSVSRIYDFDAISGAK